MKKSDQAFARMKGEQAISMVTAYTYPIARTVEQAGIPIILVGDTVGMVEMGFESTRSVTMDHMLYHVEAVRRGAPETHIIGDLPYLADKDPEIALQNANRLLNAGADSVKLEGNKPGIISHLVANDIPVVGHTGLTPQTAKDFKKVGTTPKGASSVIDDAKAIETAGVFMLVIEHVPSGLATEITNILDIPTIGIGAGSGCDGQVLVINDLLGIGEYWPPFSKQYTYLSDEIVNALQTYHEEVTTGVFPRLTR